MSTEAQQPAPVMEAITVVKPDESLEYPTLLTTVVVNSAVEALDWYEKALDARVVCRYDDPSGNIFHAILQTSFGMMIGVEDHVPKMHIVQPAAEKSDQTNIAPGSSYAYVTIPPGKGSADACVERMREFGAVVVKEPTDMFYGHRLGQVIDKFGVAWAFSHRIEAPKKAAVGEDGQAEKKEEVAAEGKAE